MIEAVFFLVAFFFTLIIAGTGLMLCSTVHNILWKSRESCHIKVPTLTRAVLIVLILSVGYSAFYAWLIYVYMNNIEPFSGQFPDSAVYASLLSVCLFPLNLSVLVKLIYPTPWPKALLISLYYYLLLAILFGLPIHLLEIRYRF
jgi:hypothetical protein